MFTLGAAVLTAIIALVGAPVPASAHGSSPVSASPDIDAVITELPGSVSVTFGEDIEAGSGSVVVTAPDGATISGASGINGATISAPLTPTATPGLYTVTVVARAADGASINGKYSFTLGDAGAETTAVSGAVTTTAVNPGPDAVLAGEISLPVVDGATVTSAIDPVVLDGEGSGSGDDQGSNLLIPVAAVLVVAAAGVVFYRFRGKRG